MRFAARLTAGALCLFSLAAHAEVYAVRQLFSSAAAGQPDQASVIVRLQPSPGFVFNEETILNLPLPMTLAAWDDRGRRMFLVPTAGADARLYVADLQTGTSTPSPIDATGMSFGFVQSRGQLYGVTSGASRAVLAIDPVSWAVTTLATLPFDLRIAGVDDRRGRLFLTEPDSAVSAHSLYAFDLVSASLSAPLTSIGNYAVVFDDPRSDAIDFFDTPIGFVGSALRRFDEKTGTTTDIAFTFFPVLDGDVDVAANAYDNSHQDDWGLTHIEAFDLATGIVTRSSFLFGDHLALALTRPVVTRRRSAN